MEKYEGCFKIPWIVPSPHRRGSAGLPQAGVRSAFVVLIP